MAGKTGEAGGRLPGLFHHRWAVPILGALDRLGGGAKLITLVRTTGAGRESAVTALAALVRLQLVTRNPGYGHPLRPEYIGTPEGRRIGPLCRRLDGRLQRLGISELALRKWSMPTLHTLAGTAGRFNVLLAALAGITPRALTQALRDLEAAGLISRRLVDDHPPRTEYALTRSGRRLIPLLGTLSEALA